MTVANWPCEKCGKDGSPDEHVLLVTGRLSLGTLRAHTFCPDHDPRTATAGDAKERR